MFEFDAIEGEYECLESSPSHAPSDLTLLHAARCGSFALPYCLSFLPPPGSIDGVVYTDGKMLPPDASGLILTLGRGHPPFYLASELRDHS